MTKYIVLVAGRNLKNEGGSSASISVVRMESGEEEEIGKTAQVGGDTPLFDEVLEFDCQNTDDLLKVTILDENDQSRGVATFTISNVLAHRRNLGVLEMSAERGAVVVHMVEKIDKGSLRLKLKGEDLKNVEGITGLRKPDPFFVLSTLISPVWTKVFTSPAVENTLDPEWDEVELNLKELCEGDLEKAVKLEVRDEESFGKKAVPIGSLETTVNQLLSKGSMVLQESDERTGTLSVESAELIDFVNSSADAKQFMQVVAGALQKRSAAVDQSRAMEKLKEEVVAAKAAAEAAQLEAVQKQEAVAAAEAGLAEAMAAAEAAEAQIGGLE